MEKPKLRDYLSSPELQAFCGQINPKELMKYTEALEVYINHLEKS